ncbi:unnamed protein product [Blepharisma stoltei]|uniref:Uncharacterized protein n=1 Tax=Blepharisma stoltei TaxID=1481888 RepID=A0AAU9KA14_9CILI|nr:unnamed protein product [Blepharisma stoltei]
MARRDYDFLFKLVLVGDSGVGKSCLLLRFADDTFSESYISTIGVDFRFKTFTIDNKLVKLQIWDTAGQERFRTITSAYYRGADAILIVFDKTNKESLDHIKDWVEEINKYSEGSVRVLLGNKCDRNDKVEVSEEMGQKYAEMYGMMYVETSALSAHHVSEAFFMATRELVQKKEKKTPKGKKLDDLKKIRKKSKCC